MTEPAVLVCGLSSRPLEETLPGSVEQWCIYCAAGVWLSPQGQRFAEREPNLRITCTECAVGLMVQDEEVVVAPVPGIPIPDAMATAALRMLKEMVEERKAQGE